MKFVKYEGENPTKKKYTKLEGYLREFINMDVKVVTVHFDEHEYKSASSCYKSLYNAIRRYTLPVDVVLRNGEVYLVRRDM